MRSISRILYQILVQIHFSMLFFLFLLSTTNQNLCFCYNPLKRNISRYQDLTFIQTSLNFAYSSLHHLVIIFIFNHFFSYSCHLLYLSYSYKYFIVSRHYCNTSSPIAQYHTLIVYVKAHLVAICANFPHCDFRKFFASKLPD